MALRVVDEIVELMSVAWGYLEQQPWAALIERVDGVVAQLYRLAHP